MFSETTDPRSWSPRRRRRVKATRIFVVFTAFASAATFLGGYEWQSVKARQQKSQLSVRAPSDSAARDEALAAIDEAIRAKSEKRTAGALAALDRARRTDPSVPGLDAALAEIALKEKQFIEMRAAAGAAKKKGDHAGGAALLLGMDKWINRGASDQEMSAAADAASVYFAEATESDFFYAPAWFFWGDVLRYAGRESEGRNRALAALYRFNPWDSSDVITAKIVFASSEAGDSVLGGEAFLDNPPWIRALGGFANSRLAGVGGSPQRLVAHAARAAVEALTGDPYVQSPTGSAESGAN